MIAADKVAELLKNLVSIPSVSGEEGEVVNYIIEYLKSKKLNAFAQGENAVVHIPGAASDKALILNGHVDTVASGNASAWRYGPFTPIIDKGKLYGLGSSDMKAGVAALMCLAAEYAKHKPPCDLWFCFVVGEEVDGHGTESFLDWFFVEGHQKEYRSIEAVIGEPTSLEFIGIGHRGNAFIELKIMGDSGHASAPDKIKQNSIKNLAEVSQQLRKLEARLAKKYKHEHLNVPTIGLTGVVAGDPAVTNKVPAIAKLMLDIRTTPLLHDELNRELDKFVKSMPFTIYYHFVDSCPVGWCPESSLLRSLLEKHQPKTKQKPIEGSADLCFFSEKGIPAITYGPGQRDCIHMVDEYVEVAKLEPYLGQMRNLIKLYGG